MIIKANEQEIRKALEKTNEVYNNNIDFLKLEAVGKNKYRR